MSIINQPATNAAVAKPAPAPAPFLASSEPLGAVLNAPNAAAKEVELNPHAPNELPPEPIQEGDEKYVKEPMIPTKPVQPADRAPSNWDMKPTTHPEVVTAFNMITQKLFTGTRKAFSEFIRSL